MALVLAFEDAKPNQVKIEGSASEGTRGTSYKTKFFGSRENPHFPHASLTRRDPGRVSSAHFHTHDQFQVVIEGKGTLGRHILSPYVVHFSRAYTPYGPFATDAVVPLTFFVLRAHYDAGSQRLPQKREHLNGVADRHPWQITRTAEFSEPQSRAATADVVLKPIPDMEDADGLAAYTLAMKPNAKAYTPDPSQGDGQYVVVVQGGFRHDSKEHEAPALVFITPSEGAYEIQAGTKGLRALVLNFPRPQARAAVAASAQAIPGFRRWQCGLCAFVYDEALGLPAEEIVPGTFWQDVSEAWSCPDCSAAKGDFHVVER